MKVKDQILELRDRGYSYRDIQNKLKCSKGTISYHCGEGQKDKTSKRRKSRRNKQHPLKTKLERFLYRSKCLDKNSQENNRTLNKILYQKIQTFSTNNRREYNGMSFTVEDLLNKIGDNPACALTGRSIDLLNSRSYQLDHIIPKAKGGDNSLENCQIACREANQAKHDLTLEDFISLCREVVDYHDSKKLRD
jgi:5-methylcytosine-specific restriction endonuclease McrA